MLFTKNRFLQTALLFCILFFLTLFVYGGALDNFFTSDDFLLLKMGKDFSAQGILKPIPGDFFRPVIKPVFAVLFGFFGLDPFPYRLLIFILHSINALLVFFLVKIISKNKKTAFFSSLAFTVFFLNSEVLFWVGTINELLLLFFSLLSIILFWLFLENKRALFFLASILFFILAILSKESAIVLWLMLLAIELFSFKSKHGIKSGILWILRRQAVFALLVFVYLAVRFFNSQPPTFNSASVFLSNYFQAFVALFIPFDFFAVFVARPLNGNPIMLVPLGTVFLAFFALLTVALSTGKKLLAFSLFWCFFSLFPPLAFGAIQARYFYLPAVGSSIALVTVASIFLKRAFGWTKRRDKMLVLKVALIVTFCFILLSASYSWKHEKKEALAGEMAKNFIEDTNRFVAGYPDSKLVFLNRIDRIDTPLDFDAPLVLRNGAAEAFELFGIPIKSFNLNASLRDANVAIGKSNSIVLLFDSEKKRLLKVKSFALGPNLLEETDLVVSSDSFLGKKVFSKKIGLQSNGSSFFDFSFKAFSGDSPAYAYFFMCKDVAASGCSGFKGEDWTAFEAGTTEKGKLLEASALVEVPQKFSFIIVRFDVKGTGKAAFSNVSIRRAFFEFE